MKLCRFDDHKIGVVVGDSVRDITSLAEAEMNPSQALGDPLIVALPAVQRQLSSGLDKFACTPLSKVTLLSPVARPGKIVAAPVNYRAHITEMQASNISPGHNIPDIDRAGLFLKATSSLVGAGQGIAVRFPDRRTDFEIELVAVIGKTASNITRDQALDCVAGYCLGLDITMRGTEDRSFRKSIDTYTVIGPWLTVAPELDPNDLNIVLRQNDFVRQNGKTADLIYSVERVIEFASSFYTLRPGDLIFTGTPDGVGPLHPGDVLHASCEELGAMDVSVRKFES
jgi:2-keto-4-pentenoate hydratase/2-oxohepta-3-ene-1,7-dioic acid hydratase in catechol pathway